MAFDQHSAATQIITPPGDPTGPHVAQSCFDFLLIELVPLAYRLAAAAADRDAEAQSLRQPSNNNNAARTSKTKSVDGGAASSVTTTGTAGGEKGAKGVVSKGHALGTGGIGGAVRGWDEEETRESVFWRLDSLGYRVGLGIVERLVCSVCAEMEARLC
jgi:trafficking protein particle complex subunit 6